MIHGDTLEIINGPEDGATYQLLGGIADLGTGIDCAVQLRMDPYIEAYQAQIIGTRDGYKVRALGKGRVQVDGARAGRVKGRMMRAGSILRVGETELYLHLSEDCAEERVQGGGGVAQSDFGYALMLAGRKLRWLGRGMFSVSGGLLRHILRPRYLVPLGILVLLYFVVQSRGGVLRQISLIIQWGIHYVRLLLSHIG